MAAGIASGFVRKLYRILDQENESIVGWDASGLSFSIHDSQQLNDSVLPRYFRGRMSAFRQQLLDHGFRQVECEDDESRECYAHQHFIRGCPDRLSYIVRVPKPKLKAGASLPSVTPPPPPQRQPQVNYPVANGHNHPPSSLGIQIAPGVRGATRAPLTVTLMTGKRSSPVHSAQEDAAQKRLRALATAPIVNGPAPTPAPPANLSRNPLFSNESSTDGLDVARVFSLSRISDSGLFTNSTDLPEPISYLNKILHGHGSSTTAHSATQASSTSSAASSSAPPAVDAPVFSEDMMKSALFFLASGTGIDTNGNAIEPSVRPDNDVWAAHMQRLSTSGFLSSLMVSSSTGRDTGGGGGSALSSSSVWGSANANPLFSKSSEQDEEEEDSIWNLLVASSIDRVKTAIHDVVSPQERLRMILEERERLEEQRKRIYGLANDTDQSNSTTNVTPSGPHKPTETVSAKPLKSALKKTSPTAAGATAANPLFSASSKPAANPLFSKPTAPTANPLFSKPAATKSSNPLFSNEDDNDMDGGETVGRSNPNPLFAKSVSSSSTSKPTNLLFSKPATATTNGNPATTPATDSTPSLTRLPSSNAEDGLWRLLMTSSVDWFRKGVAELDNFEV